MKQVTIDSSAFATLRALAPNHLAAFAAQRRSLKYLAELELLRLGNDDHFLTKRLRSHFAFVIHHFITAILRNLVTAKEQAKYLREQKYTLQDLLLDSYTVRANAPNARANFGAAVIA
jgi:hypothetical protein